MFGVLYPTAVTGQSVPCLVCVGHCSDRSPSAQRLLCGGNAVADPSVPCLVFVGYCSDRSECPMSGVRGPLK
jgi:hypothetical protein